MQERMMMVSQPAKPRGGRMETDGWKDDGPKNTKLNVLQSRWKRMDGNGWMERVGGGGGGGGWLTIVEWEVEPGPSWSILVHLEEG